MEMENVRRPPPTDSNKTIKKSYISPPPTSLLSFENLITDSYTAPHSDVFLSFRGVDTRKAFVDHLYTALVQQGIQTYKDDETLPRGVFIAPSLLEAIQNSRIAVIVFSENYADSSWCLDELECIIKCMNERGQIVFPVFYDVKPTEVRKQIGKFGLGFSKHHDKKVESWRNALRIAAGLAGWETKNVANGYESKCIKEIVDTISRKLFHLLSSDDTNLVGMRTRKYDLKASLHLYSFGVIRMVGIWGIGGCGKTTLARCIFDEMSNQGMSNGGNTTMSNRIIDEIPGSFDRCCFVSSIREEASKYGLKKLQGEIISVVLGIEAEVGSVEEGMRMIKGRLRHRKVLLILDDVDDVGQLDALAGSHEWFGAGSRIIITTRDKHLLTSHNVDDIYNMPLLNYGEALELFCRHAFRLSWPLEGFEDISRNVVSKVHGLSLALKVLGSSLRGRDISEWKSMLARLEDNPDSMVMQNLRSGYEGLQEVEKELFLDIVCFYTLRSIDWAMVMLDACGFHTGIGVKVLIEKAFITIMNGRFYVHELLQELGHYIVRDKHFNSPEKHTRVWRKDDVLKIYALDVAVENDMNIEALRFDYFKDDPPKTVPSVVANMKKLRWLYWEGYPASLLPASFQPTVLCCLVLEDGLQKQLWRGYKYLPSLKVLDLRDSSNLIKSPDFYGLPSLERLILKDCSNLKKIHPSIGYHERIKFLDMKGCSSLKTFPHIVLMTELETLILSSCFQLCKFPVIHTEMPHLQEISLASSGIKVLPSSVGKYCISLVSLDLSDCRNLRSIKGTFCSLKSLEVLHLRGCIQLEKLPEFLFDRPCQLRDLSLCRSPHPEHTIVNCLMNHTRLQFCIQDLVSSRLPHFPLYLRRLSLRRCNLGDGDIPSDICELTNLEELDLSENNFSRLHSILSQIPHLKYLNLSDCQNLVELPCLPSSITVLKAYRCDSLEIVENLPTNYKWLWKVSLWRKSKLIGGNKVLQTMLQGNAIKDHFLSMRIGGCYIQSSFDRINTDNSLVFKDKTFTLELPKDWFKDFSGFLICVANLRCVKHTITIKQERQMDYQSDPWIEFDKTPEFDTNMEVGYISFGSLSRTSWWKWNSFNLVSTISFFIEDLADPGFKVGLVPRKSRGDSMESAQSETYCPEYWDEGVEGRNTFMIQHDSKSSIKIFWSHRCADWA